MTPKTIRNIHSILSGAFAAAVRWEWIDRNPAESAKPPKVPHRRPASPSPETVAKVVAAARESDPALAVYLWLAAVTGARRGELCGLQWADVDLGAGTVCIAFSYLVRDGQRLRKDTKTHQATLPAPDDVAGSGLTTVRAVLATPKMSAPGCILGVQHRGRGSGARIGTAGARTPRRHWQTFPHLND
jgi:hypothetical protein